MYNYKIITEQEHTTVMSHYEALPREERGYQSEAALENAFIHQLKEQGCECVNITSEKEMISNLRKQMDRLNGYLFHYMGPLFKIIESKTAGGSVKHLSAKTINNIQISVPSLSEQNRIVGILETFTASISNLEAQLKQRQKQYEYYRNKLLTFE